WKKLKPYLVTNETPERAAGVISNKYCSLLPTYLGDLKQFYTTFFSPEQKQFQDMDKIFQILAKPCSLQEEIIKLPEEIIHEIIEYLPSIDLKNFRLSCKYIATKSSVFDIYKAKFRERRVENNIDGMIENTHNVLYHAIKESTTRRILEYFFSHTSI